MTLALSLARSKFPSLLHRFKMLAGAVARSSLVYRTRRRPSRRGIMSSCPACCACTCIIGADPSTDLRDAEFT